MVVLISKYGWLQGTASVVLAGLLASLKVVGGTLAEHTYLFLGAGEVSDTVIGS
jgi:malic enzyme